jgi:predicted PurR-regulated permease PerM
MRIIERKLSHYFFTVALITAVLGVAIGVAMWWLHVVKPVSLKKILDLVSERST